MGWGKVREPYLAASGFADDRFEENYQAAGVVLLGEDGYYKDLALRRIERMLEQV
ncbi:MAG: hypothetical protein ACOX2N_05340 [Peptococcia bacterium]|jgi:hypothetical protein